MHIILTILIFITGLLSLYPEENRYDDEEDLFLNRIRQGIYTPGDRLIFDRLTLSYSFQNQRDGLDLLYGLLGLAINHGLDTLIYDSHRSLGLLYSQLGISDKAIENNLLASNFYKKTGEQGNYNWTLVNTGNTYYWEDINEMALQYYENALTGFEKMTVKSGASGSPESIQEYNTGIDGMSVAMNNIALCHIKAGEYEKAIDYYEKSLALRAEMGSKILIAHSYGYLGHPYSLLNEDETAMDYYYRAINLLTDTTGIEKQELPLNNNTLAFTYRRIGVHYGKKNDLENAGNYFTRSVDIYNRLENYKELTNTYLVMADTYIEAGEAMNALPAAYNALKVASENEYLSDIILASKKIVSIYTATGDFKQALEYSQYIIKKDSILYRNYTDIVLQGVERGIANRLQTEDIRQLRQENIINEFNIARQRTIIVLFIISTIFTLVILIISIFYFNQKRRTNRRLKESESTLKEVNQTKDKFFSIVAHDLRGPASNMMQVTELLTIKYDKLPEERKRRFLNELHKSATGLFELLETLLLWSQSQQGAIKYKPQNISIYPLVDANLQVFSLNAENKQLEIKSSVPGDLIVYADLNMVNTILRNLISNAVKFSEKGEAIEIKAKNAGSFVEISVRDNGVGMSAGVLNNLFKLEKSGTMPGTAGERGTGLGLLISKEFVEVHGGTITAESEPGRGSKFRFTLPGHRKDQNNLSLSGNIPPDSDGFISPGWLAGRNQAV